MKSYYNQAYLLIRFFILQIWKKYGADLLLLLALPGRQIADAVATRQIN